jgi:predicted RND superfamily exporter protein
MERISKELSLDAHKRMPSFQIDPAEIDKVLDTLLTSRNYPLSMKYQRQLREQLENFFYEEADIEIESPELMGKLVTLIVNKARVGRLEPDELSVFLRENIPSRYWEQDPEAINSTARFIVSIVKEIHDNNRVSLLAGKLLTIFPEALRQDRKFVDDVRDDLWLINEELVGIPANLNIADSKKEIQLRATQSGMLRVMKKMNDDMLDSQIRSLFLALGLVLILMIIQFNSIKMGFVVTTPIFLTILINFAVMGYLHIPLDNATMMIASIAIGIGIDYAIHFSSRFKTELRQRKDEFSALEKTLKTTGKAIGINALTVALGFIILIWSNMVPLQRFGWLIALTMVVSAWASLTFLPAMLLVFKKYLFNTNGGGS